MKQDDIGFWIKRISEQIDRKINLMLRRYDLTLTQMRTLIFLRERGGQRTTLRDIEEAFGISHPTVVGIVRRLEVKGLLVCLPDEEDRRYRNVRLTNVEALERLMAELFPTRIEPALTEGFTGQELAELRRLLKLIYRNTERL